VAVLEGLITYGLIIAGTFSLVLGYGIWNGWKWTCWAVTILDVLGILYSIYTLIVVISNTSTGILYSTYMFIVVISNTSIPSLNNYAFTLSSTIPVMVICSIELWYFSRERTRLYLC